jgi:hypothetical protein
MRSSYLGCLFALLACVPVNSSPQATFSPTPIIALSPPPPLPPLCPQPLLHLLPNPLPPLHPWLRGLW